MVYTELDVKGITANNNGKIVITQKGKWKGMKGGKMERKNEGKKRKWKWKIKWKMKGK